MDRTFGSPRDVSNASPDDLARALNRVLRTLEQPTRFVYQADYEYANRRRAPLLMVGELRGAWREYVRRNAGSPHFAAGTCSVRRDEAGRVTLELVAERGRATGASHARAINTTLMRRVGGEVVFVVPAAGAATAGAAPAAAGATGAGSTRAAPAPAVPEAAAATEPADAPAAAEIFSRFKAFKAEPTADALERLVADVDRWQARRAADPGAAPDAAAAQMEKLAKMLAEKGRAYVASKRA